ncbi:MAG: hypothetical protein H6607_02685 [Flavobacteriales bacterium]|nr:hypothetical protein [Flavobacteriales bacterium]
METPHDIGKKALILAGITFFVFASMPYFLDLFFPAKSVGQIIGETARDVANGLNNQEFPAKKGSVRNTWANILTIVAFGLMAVSVFFISKAFQQKSARWYPIGASTLLVAAGGIYFTHLAIGLIGLVVVAFLAVTLVLGN